LFFWILPASSVLENKPDKYGAQKLNDSDITSWCEGKKDHGIGESITVSFKNDVKIDKFYFANGFGNSNYWNKNSRVKELEVNGEKIRTYNSPGTREYKLKKPVTGKSITFKITSVYKGLKWPDTCISELGFEPVKFKKTKNNPFGSIINKPYRYSGKDGDTIQLANGIRYNAFRFLSGGRFQLNLEETCDENCDDLPELFSTCKEVKANEFSCQPGSIKIKIKNGVPYLNDNKMELE